MTDKGMDVTHDNVRKYIRLMDQIILEKLEQGEIIEYMPGELYILPSITPDGYYEIASPNPQLKEAFENSLLRLKFKVKHP
jgi:hypothetical protein